ncbi:hypothetical protein HaloA020_25440 [Halomonas sp. A020]|nr:isochorismatase family protein [Halomonas sp. BL6]BCB61843.1 hypothetical protein HaloA020_25440 [Halomonas sp. A020]
MSATTSQRVALILIDMQQGMATEEAGERNNPQAETNIQRLLTVWRHRDEPVVHVRHLSRLPSSPFCRSFYHSPLSISCVASTVGL